MTEIQDAFKLATPQDLLILDDIIPTSKTILEHLQRVMQAVFSDQSEQNLKSLGVALANSRSVFDATIDWLDQHEKIPLDGTDATLPRPMRGQLCHAMSCFDLPKFDVSAKL